MSHKNKIIFFPVAFHNFSNHDCHLFSEELTDKKRFKKIQVILKTDEENICVTNGCLRYNDSYRFLSISSDELVKTLVDKSHKSLKKLKEEIVDNDEIIKNFNELETLMKEDRSNNDSIEDFEKKILIKV